MKTTFFIELQQAMILVKLPRSDLPSFAHIVVVLRCYSIQLWWKTPPWFVQVMSREEDAGWANQWLEKKMREVHVLLAMGVKRKRWSRQSCSLGYKMCCPLEALLLLFLQDSNEEIEEGVREGNLPCKNKRNGLMCQIQIDWVGTFLGLVVSEMGLLVQVLWRPRGKKQSFSCYWVRRLKLLGLMV